ncbi:MAG: glycoside hydrolase family 20 zincin-like fold domain-containing protein [Candidatus Helarchaeota archaeon]
MRIILTNIKRVDIENLNNEIHIIPYPQSVNLGAEGFTITRESTIIFEETQQKELLLSLLNEELGFHDLPRLQEAVIDSKVSRKHRIYSNELHEEQGYYLEIASEVIVIESKTETGLFYGMQTLLQLFQRTKEGVVYLPETYIVDFPELKIRGISDDTARGQAPTIENMKKTIRTLAKFKLNSIFYGYGSDCWELKKHPKLTEGRDVFTAEEVKILEQEAKKYHVELIPIFQSLGHMDNIAHIPEYRALMEFPGSTCLDISNPETKKFVEDLHEEILQMHSSSWVHVACDEIFDFGTFNSRPYLKQKGKSKALLEYYLWIYENVKKHGKKEIFIYHDNIASDKVLQKGLPKDLIVFFWEYFTTLTYGKIKKCRNAGFNVVVSPSVLSWTRNFPDFMKSNKNIISLIKKGIQEGAIGAVTSTWGDYGNENFRENNLYGYILTADVSWNSTTFTLDRFHEAYARQFFGTTDLKIVEAMHLISSVNQRLSGWFPIPLPQFYNEFWKHPFPAPKFKIKRKKMKKIIQDMEEGIRLLQQVKRSVKKNSDYLEYIKFGAEIGLYFAKKSLITQTVQKALNKKMDSKTKSSCIAKIRMLHDELNQLNKKYRQLWLNCAKPEGLKRLIPKQDLYLRYFKEKIEQINENIPWKNPFLESEWIAFPEKRTKQKPTYLRKTFNINGGKIKSAFLQGISHLFMTLFINGKEVGIVQSRGSLDFRPLDVAVQVFDITQYLNPGKNVIAIEASNHLQGEAAINIYCEITLENGEKTILKSEASWKVSKNMEKDWKQVSFDDLQWEMAKSLGAPPKFNGQIMKPYLDEKVPSMITITFGARLQAAAILPAQLSFLIDPVMKTLGYL